MSTTKPANGTANGTANGSASGTIPFADYMIARFKQAGVKQIFGVPGDYQLEMLDYFERDPDVQWVGNANELGAAYAADGYARVRGGLAVCVTTFGVGELSALGGIGGALAERLPVVHLVGSPRSPLQHSNALVHHTVNEPGQYQKFTQMSEPISAATCVLINVKEDSDHSLGDAFDKAIATCLEEGKPVYIDVPLDYNHKQVSRAALDKPLPKFGAPKKAWRRDLTDPPLGEVMDEVVRSILDKFTAAKNPVVLADIYAERYGMRQVVRELVEKTGMRAFCTPTSKTLLDEQASSYAGSYGGTTSLAPVSKEFEAADFVLYIGAMKSDTNTGRFTTKVHGGVEFYTDRCVIGTAEYRDIDMRELVPRLVPFLAEAAKTKGLKVKQESVEDKVKAGTVLAYKTGVEGDVISQEWFWPRMAAWFQDTDVLLGEMGTAAFGMLPLALPTNAQYHSQCMWGAIGWSVGAALGAALAAREADPNKRTLLFVGDGSLQLTVQEIGTMVRRNLCPHIFVINNDGYEIERLIHGPDAKYNDIANWDYTMLLPLFAGRTGVKHETHSVKTQDELQKLLDDKDFQKPDRIRVIEVFIPRGDAPHVLAQILQKKM